MMSFYDGIARNCRKGTRSSGGMGPSIRVFAILLINIHNFRGKSPTTVVSK
jgi:hypothetical protein